MLQLTCYHLSAKMINLLKVNKLLKRQNILLKNNLSLKRGQDFRKEFKTAASEVRSKLSSKMEFDAHIISTHKAHVMLTHTRTSRLRVAAIVDN